jgi:hypothetical protein
MLNGWLIATSFEGEFFNVPRAAPGKGVARYSWQARDFRGSHIASVSCAAEFGRYRCIADFGKLSTGHIYDGFTA